MQHSPNSAELHIEDAGSAPDLSVYEAEFLSEKAFGDEDPNCGEMDGSTHDNKESGNSSEQMEEDSTCLGHAVRGSQNSEYGVDSGGTMRWQLPTDVTNLDDILGNNAFHFSESIRLHSHTDGTLG